MNTTFNPGDVVAIADHVEITARLKQAAERTGVITEIYADDNPATANVDFSVPGAPGRKLRRVLPLSDLVAAA